jgi:hypothetical protein
MEKTLMGTLRGGSPNLSSNKKGIIQSNKRFLVRHNSLAI